MFRVIPTANGNDLLDSKQFSAGRFIGNQRLETWLESNHDERSCCE
ncbi:hypothetical protein DET61_1056 [Marinobacter nauticus]|uniref:Uncharacterized protein n=1 Tax=Marinobacter nauticus TaxID=2743 RepID=A0A368XPR0_MARNT|nr:hypothetical protein DET61_1056 [Marinobacter nauticus]